MVVGAGVVGQATGKGFIKKGYNVLFVDVNPDTISKLKSQGFSAYLPDQLDNLDDISIAMFCVSTPSKDDGSVNLEYLKSAVTNHGKWLRNNNNNNHVVVIRSTVPPGTTKNILLPLLEENSGKKAGFDFGLCMQPEFLRAKTSETDFLNPWATVIGEFDKNSGDILEKLYVDFGGPLFRVDIETAEFMKYIHNCYNATKISFTNEMWKLGKGIGLDANKALKLAVVSTEGFWNPSYGTVGGYPYGGACLPKDTKGLLGFAKQIGVEMPLLSAVDRVNSEMEDKMLYANMMGKIISIQKSITL